VGGPCTGRCGATEGAALPASEHDPEKWVPVSGLREALARLVVWLDASAGEGRSEKIMLQQ
jgi:hypothetical protein